MIDSRLRQHASTLSKLFSLSSRAGWLLVGIFQFQTASAQIVTLTFEGLPGMHNNAAVSGPPGEFVAPAFRLSDQFLGSHGVVFKSGSIAPYVAVVNVLGSNQLPSGTNAIGGVNNSIGLDYAVPIDISLYALGDTNRPAETHFISIKSDLVPLGFGTVRCDAFDANGQLLQSITDSDTHPVVFTFFRPRIHRIRLTQTNGSLAFDDLSFAPPVPIGQPQLTIEFSQVRLCYTTQTNKTYQLQYRSALTTNVWVNLGSPFLGDGTTNCVTEPITDPHRYFRVSIVP